MFAVISRLKRRHRRRKEKKQRQRQQQQQDQPPSSRVGPSVRLTSRSSSNNNDTSNSNRTTNSNRTVPTSPPLGLATDVDQKMPLLYSLARAWAWDAVAYRCRTNPNEATAVDYLGDSVLHWAAFGSAPIHAIAALLTAYPAAARWRNRSGQTPLHVACSYRASSSVIAALRQAYPAAVHVAMHPHNSRATPLHCLCDYGGSTYSPHHHSSLHPNSQQHGPPEYDSVRSLRILLAGGNDEDPDDSSVLPSSINMLDELYQRRPLEILNARKNLYQEQHITEMMQNIRTRQRALRAQWLEEQQQAENDIDAEPDWQERSELQLELLDQWEEDIRQYRYTEFWQKASLILVAEYQFILAETNYVTQPRLPDCFRTTDPQEEDERCIKILHAAVGNPRCPESLQQYAILLYEPFLAAPDADHADRLPLHVAAWRCAHDGGARAQLLLAQLIRAYPEAAHVRDRDGNVPLHLALQSPSRWSPALGALIDANPMVLLERSMGLLNFDSSDHIPDELLVKDQTEVVVDDEDENNLQKECVTITAMGLTNPEDGLDDVETQDRSVAPPCLYPQIFARLSPQSLFPLFQANLGLLTRFKTPSLLSSDTPLLLRGERLSL